MATLDRFIQAMYQYGSPEIQLMTGERPNLQFPDSPRPLIGKALNAQQILDIVAEIAPPGLREELQAHPSLNFQYGPPGAAPVVVYVARQNGTLSAWVRPASGVQPPQATSAPPRAAAPPPPPTAQAPAPRPSGVEPGEADGLAIEEVLRPEQDGKPAIERLFRLMVSMGASDLHLSATVRPMVRVDGVMRFIDGYPPIQPQAMESLLVPILSERHLAQYKEIRDTDFGYEIEGLCRFRCNVFADRKGMGAVFRQIPNRIMTPEELGLTKPMLDLCQLSKGLVVVTGPTGSGKSTTLATMIDVINKTRTDHIITIEDPIEFVHANKKCLINQREVGTHTSSFKHALRAALREDPDIVLVGEMRDLETVAIAIETAETGHLVFATLHTNTAPSTVDRIIDQFPPDRQGQIRVMLSEVLRGVIAQTLCKKIGGGRIAAMEVLLGIPSVSNLIREAKIFQIPSIMQTARGQGMVTLNQALFDLLKEKKIDLQEAWFRSVDKMDFRGMLERNGHKTDGLG